MPEAGRGGQSDDDGEERDLVGSDRGPVDGPDDQVGQGPVEIEIDQFFDLGQF